MLAIQVSQLDPELPLPSYAYPGDAGADLYARSGASLKAGGGRAVVPTGVVVAIPAGYAGFVLPRSGLAFRHGVTCLNTPGLIDAGFRGELSVLLINTDSSADYEVQRGDRIAQLVVHPVEQVLFEVMAETELPPAERGPGGYGHTGR